MHSSERVGVLLINTGSTAAPRTAETRAYLREFLSDPRVLDINPVVRWFLLNFVILRRRPKKSAHAYDQIWTEDGSPLLAITRDLVVGLKERMPNTAFAIGMRYGEPSIERGLNKLVEENVDRIILAPLFPQYSSTANGSALELAYKLAGELWNVPAFSALPPFYGDPAFIDSWVAVSKPVLDSFKPDLVLMSYHGLPERHVKKSDTTGTHCLESDDCCDAMCAANTWCYRAHCFETSRLLSQRLGLGPDDYTIAFQSRLGRDPWIQPPTDVVVPDLAREGIKRLAVMCPSFTTDCLETLEEIGLRAESDFLSAGGEALQFIPCLNSHPIWMDALVRMLQRI